MKTVKVKICGVRMIEAAQAAVESGADFLGFNFVAASRRYIQPQAASKIIDAVRGRVKVVGVFQDEALEVVTRISKQLGLDLVQLHGREDQEYIGQMGMGVMKVIHSVDEVALYSVDYWMLDRMKQGEGEMVDVDMAKELAKKYEVFLAGGLTVENVAGIVEIVRPFAVDVAGGIETDGVEDVGKIREFINRAKSVMY